jgi:hypothetical protein
MPAKTVLDQLLTMRETMLRIRTETDYSDHTVKTYAKDLDVMLARLIDLLAARRAEASEQASTRIGAPRAQVNSASIANRTAR